MQIKRRILVISSHNEIISSLDEVISSHDEVISSHDEIPVVVGPTASGKTAYALSLAKDIGAEIVSADSMQVYRHMDIGTAKVSLKDRQDVPHHMIDVAEPDMRFSVVDYQQMALRCIDDIISRGKKVVIAGGTGLYVSALINNIKYPESAAAPAFRERMELEAQTSGNAVLYAKLMEIDKAAAGRIHMNDKKRIIRALEVYHATGKTISEYEAISRSVPPKYRFCLIGMNVARDELYRRIDARVDQMFREGLVCEARAIYERYGKLGTALQAIGYKELFAYFEGALTIDEASRRIKTETRRYAKRQMTWFRAMPDIKWIDA